MPAAQSIGKTNKELSKLLRTPVARFYPCDFHVHSLGSYDVWQAGHFNSLPREITDLARKLVPSFDFPLSKPPQDAAHFDDQMTRPELVAAFLDALETRRNIIAGQEGLSDTDNWCIVGITDHNTANFSSELSRHAWELRSTKRIVVLPGIELDVAFPVSAGLELCQVHILCLFAPCTKSSDIRLAINDARTPSTGSWSFGLTLEVASLSAFVQAVRSHSTYPAICIGAHVWSKKGVQNEPTKLLFASVDAEIVRLEAELIRANAENEHNEAKDINLRIAAAKSKKTDATEIHMQVLKIIGNCGFDALQVLDRSHETHYRRLHRFRDQHGRSVPIVSSDAHSPDKVFSCASGIPYVKMSATSLSADSPATVFEDIRQKALRFGETRTTYTTPGAVSTWIEGIEIAPDSQGARSFWTPMNPEAGSPFVLGLSRNLNCFVGGRGSGKSAGVEAIAFLGLPKQFEDEAKKKQQQQSDWYLRAQATLSGCRIRMVWKSSSSNGIGSLPKRALFVSRYFDPDGQHSALDLRDIDGNAIVDPTIIAPELRVLRVHEIEETARWENLRKLFDELCGERIDQLNEEIAIQCRALAAQRTEINDVVSRLRQLVSESSPLRQYGIRKKQYEAVNKVELSARFAEVDQAETVAKCAKGVRKEFDELSIETSLSTMAIGLNSFLDAVRGQTSDAEANTLPGHQAIHAIGKSEPELGPNHPAAQLISSLDGAKKGAADLSAAIDHVVLQASNNHTEQIDALVKDGLPAGSGERESKKKAFDAAVTDYGKYKEHVKTLNELFQGRKVLHDQLVVASKERTKVRTSRAAELTQQLRRDLDEKVLLIEVVAKPMGDQSAFAKWIQENIEPTFQRYKPHRGRALLSAGILPSTIRDILLDPSKPDVSRLQNEHEKAELGRIDGEDANSILQKCRGLRIVPLDEAENWDKEFVESLPTEIRDGVLTFPVIDAPFSTCIDRVLQLDEVVLDDTAEVRLNDRPADPLSVPRPLESLSPGQRCSAILPILLLSGDYPLIIDQPEENLDNRLIRQVIVNILASMKLRRQIIIATHNPNLPVLGDVEQCIVMQATGRDLSTVVSLGNLDSADVARYITDIMEGGREAFQYRQSIYQCHWKGAVDALP